MRESVLCISPGTLVERSPDDFTLPCTYFYYGTSAAKRWA
jgi:hypothetical protein